LSIPQEADAQGQSREMDIRIFMALLDKFGIALTIVRMGSKIQGDGIKRYSNKGQNFPYL
jgi:hypothetical protein